jgi:hypothetical protein
MSIDTKRVSGRRHLQFSSYEQILDDVRALSAAPSRQLGNWSLGRICKHLAGAMDMAVDGPTFRPPWYIRMAGPFIKTRFLSRPMTPGFRLPSRAKALLPDETSASEGIAALERSIERLRQAPQRKPHFVFGPMTSEEWDRLNFLHAAMHLSFIVPE